MANPRRMVGVPAGQQFRVACADGNVRHSGAFNDYGRAAHWAIQDTGCCPGQPHHVIPAVVTTRAVQP